MALKALKKLKTAKPKTTEEHDVDIDLDDDTEVEVEAKPSKIKGLKKPNKVEEPVEVEDEDELDDDEELDDEDETDSLDEEESEDEIESDDEIEEDDDIEDEVEVEKPKAAKKGKAEKAEKPAKEKEPTTGRSLFAKKAKAEKPAKVLKEGDTITREEIERRFADKLGCTKADASRVIKAFEELMTQDVFPHYEVNLFGVKFKRSIVAERIHSGTGGLKVKDDGLSTLIPAHIQVVGKIEYGKERIRGKVDKNGEFKRVKK